MTFYPATAVWAPTPATAEQQLRLRKLVRLIADDQTDWFGEHMQVWGGMTVSVQMAEHEVEEGDYAAVLRQAAVNLREHYSDSLGARQLTELAGKVRHGHVDLDELMAEGVAAHG